MNKNITERIQLQFDGRPWSIGYSASTPKRTQEGFKVSIQPKLVLFDAWFEGRLITLIRFKTAPLS